MGSPRVGHYLETKQQPPPQEYIEFHGKMNDLVFWLGVWKENYCRQGDLDEACRLNCGGSTKYKDVFVSYSCLTERIHQVKVLNS